MNKALGVLALVVLGVVFLCRDLPRKDSSQPAVGTEVSYWMNFSEPGELPGLKPFDATIHAVRDDGSADLLVMLPKGNQIKVAKAERADRAKAGCWTPKNSSKDRPGTTNSPRSDP